jgi:hypothetical protein
MKKVLLLMLVLMTAVSAFAQSDDKSGKTGEEFFLGKWELLVEGLPTGDAKMLLVVEKTEEGKYKGTIGGTDGSATSPLTKVVIEPTTMTVNFSGQGFDVPLYLDKEKDGTVSGSMNDMFDVTGKRFVESK